MIKLHGLPIDLLEKPSMAGNFSGRCIVTGCARGLWDDLKYLADKGISGDVFAVNMTGLIHARPISHFGSCHPKIVDLVLKMRRLEHTKESHVFGYSNAPAPGVAQHWPFAIGGGTSGLFCTMVALCLGYDEIILAGIPMDATGKFYQSSHMAEEYGGNTRWNYGCTGTFGTWQQVFHQSEEFRKRVRSVSGNTKRLLGGVP